MPKISAEERSKILNIKELNKLLKVAREDRKSAVQKLRSMRKKRTG